MAIKPLNSVAGFSVGETPSNVILGNGDIIANNLSVNGVSNLNAIGNVYISGGTVGQVISTDGLGNLTFVTIDTWRIQNGTSNVQITPVNGNVTVTVAGNANIATFTGTGANISGTLSVSGNSNVANLGVGQVLATGNIVGSYLTSNANIVVNNFLKTPAATDLILDPSSQLTRNYGNLDPYTGGYYLGGGTRWEGIRANSGEFNTTLSVIGNANVGNLGTNGLISATGNITGGNLSAVGNVTAANVNATNGFFGNLSLSGDITVNSLTSNTFVSATGNLVAGGIKTDNYYYANGAPVDFQQPAGTNTQIQYNKNDDFGASANFTFNDTTNNLFLNGNLLLGANSQNQIVPLSNTALEIRGGWNNATVATVALVAGDYANGSNWGKTTLYGNLTGNATFQVEANIVNIQPAGGGANIVKFSTLSPAATSTTTGAIQVAGGIGVGGNGYFGGNVSVNGDIANANNVYVTNLLSSNSGNFTSNVIANNLTVNLDVSGNTANFTGNISSLNANLGNLATANYINVANDVNVNGNVVASNLVGPLANGSSNVKVYQNANVEITINGVANVATFDSTGLYVVGEINTTAGNMLSNGNVTANGFVNAANGNITGELIAGSVLTANITAPTGNITISAAGTNQDIILNPSGTGAVDVGLHKIIQLGDPTSPHDAATKEYVDNVSQGLYVHTPVYVTSTSDLLTTYNNGGTNLTVTTISGGKTITFSANHGLAVNDDMEFTNSFNGIIAGEGYFVYSVPALNQITIKDGYFGAEITTLTNGTGLTQPAVGNAGTGATLTNAGANAALSIDTITLSLGDRVLVQGQTNQVKNGVYTVTNPGSLSTQWVMTRATDADSYAPKSTTALCAGSYFFVQEGYNNKGSSYVLTSPTGEIHFGTSNIQFTQFQAAGGYTAGSGINISGTIISANTDGVTTDIIGGNIVVKPSAQLTTPNIGAATGTSLSVSGNITANNLSVGNVANIGTDLTVGNSIVANANITSNAWLTGNNLFVTNNANIQGNLLADYITANHTVFTNNANISSNLLTNNATINLALSGNTANFSGNVIVANLTVNTSLSGNYANFTNNVVSNNSKVNLELSGNTANFSGNVILANLQVNTELSGNYANFTNNVVSNNSKVNLEFTGNTANFSGNVILPNIQVNLELAGNTANFSGNVIVPNLTVNLELSGNTANFSGDLIANDLKANITTYIGNTLITWDTTTTSSITANQTISSFNVTGVTGVEYIVKAIDSTGSKYSVATVQAVTDGSSVDYATYGTVQLGGYTGSLAVNIVGGFIRLQVTPASSNSTVWTTQYRLI